MRYGHENLLPPAGSKLSCALYTVGSSTRLLIYSCCLLPNTNTTGTNWSMPGNAPNTHPEPTHIAMTSSPSLIPTAHTYNYVCLLAATATARFFSVGCPGGILFGHFACSLAWIDGDDGAAALTVPVSSSAAAPATFQLL